MKAFLLLLLISLPGIAQETHNFELKDNSLIWQHVFESELSQEEIKSILEADPLLNPLAATFIGQSNPTGLKCEGTTAIYFDAQVFYFAQLQFKEGRYKVEISNFQLIPDYTVSIYGVESGSGAEPLDKYVIKNNSPTIRPGTMHQNALNCLHEHLMQKFSFQQPEEGNDW